MSADVGRCLTGTHKRSLWLAAAISNRERTTRSFSNSNNNIRNPLNKEL
jgi:hypothetical protein